MKKQKYISAAILGAIIFITILQVILRAFFNIPLVGIEELARYLFISFIFLGLSYYNRVDGHIKLDGIQKYLPIKLKRIIGIVIQMSSVLVFGIITYSAIHTSITNFKSTTPTLAIPFWLFFLPTMIGFILLTVEEVFILIRVCRKEVSEWA